MGLLQVPSQYNLVNSRGIAYKTNFTNHCLAVFEVKDVIKKFIKDFREEVSNKNKKNGQIAMDKIITCKRRHGRLISKTLGRRIPNDGIKQEHGKRSFSGNEYNSYIVRQMYHYFEC